MALQSLGSVVPAPKERLSRASKMKVPIALLWKRAEGRPAVDVIFTLLSVRNPTVLEVVAMKEGNSDKTAFVIEMALTEPSQLGSAKGCPSDAKRRPMVVREVKLDQEDGMVPEMTEFPSKRKE